jgi:hypothetical protein
MYEMAAMGRWTWTGLGSQTTLSACTGSCSGCGATSSRRNAVTSVQREDAFPRQVVEALVLMTFPLASHVSFELWERLGHQDRIDDVAFPVADPEAIREDSVTIPVTLDGKPRGTITIARDAVEDDAMAAGLQLRNVASLVEDREIARVAFVAGKILNIVTMSGSPLISDLAARQFRASDPNLPAFR